MTIRMLTLAGACATLAACASPPAPVAMPQSMSLPPAPLPSGETTRAATGTGALSSSEAFTPEPGSSRLSTMPPDAAGNSMAIPESSMGNLRRPPARAR